MAAPAITLQLPEPLYDQVRDRAKRARRTPEAEILRIVAAAMPTEDVLPTELEQEIAALESISDEALHESARLVSRPRRARGSSLFISSSTIRVWTARRRRSSPSFSAGTSAPS